MKVNTKINESVVNYRFNFDKTSDNFLRPIVEEYEVLVPLTTAKLNFIPNKDMTIFGNKIVSIDYSNKDELNVVLRTESPNVTMKYNKDEFEESKIEDMLNIEDVKAFIPSLNSVDLYWIARNINSTYDLEYVDNVMSGNIDTSNEHERQKMCLYVLLTKFKLKVQTFISEESARYSVYTRYLGGLDLDYQTLYLYILAKYGIPFSDSDIGLLTSKLSESILGRYTIKKLWG